MYYNFAYTKSMGSLSNSQLVTFIFAIFLCMGVTFLVASGYRHLVRDRDSRASNTQINPSKSLVFNAFLTK